MISETNLPKMRPFVSCCSPKRHFFGFYSPNFMRGNSPPHPFPIWGGLFPHPPTRKHANRLKTNNLHKPQKGRFKAVMAVRGILLPLRPSCPSTAVFAQNNSNATGARKQNCFILQIKNAILHVWRADCKKILC